MSSSSVTPFETILKLCYQAGHEPWYPGEFAESMGIPASRLGGPIEELKSAGLIQPTPWSQERGPGYRLTDAGVEVLQSPKLMARVRRGDLPVLELDRHEAPSEGSVTAENKVVASLAGKSTPYLTYAILAINVLLFLYAMSIALKGNAGQRNVQLFLMAGDKAARHQTGAVTSGDLMNGQWWRLMTSFFVHKDFFHLFIVMSTFMGFARRAEQFWGPLRFALIYGVAGLAGICLPLLRDPADAPVGAEGAVCGSLASIVVWFLLNKRYIPDEIFRQGFRQAVVGFGWFIAWAAFLAFLGAPRLSWSGYVAGTIAGALVAVGLNLQRFLDSPVRWIFAAPVVIVPVLCVGLLIRARAKDPAWKGKAAEIGAQQKRGDEFEIFNKQLSPVIRDARAFRSQRWKSIGELCDERPARRKDVDVAKAKQTLRDARQDTEKALATIVAAGRFEVDRVTDVLRAATTFLNEQKVLIDLAERCLQDGEDFGAEDLKKLHEQAEQTLVSMKIYDKK